MKLAITHHFLSKTKRELAYGKLSNNLKRNITLIGALTTSSLLLSYPLANRQIKDFW
jgi:hypothetical protein